MHGILNHFAGDFMNETHHHRLLGKNIVNDLMFIYACVQGDHAKYKFWNFCYL